MNEPPPQPPPNDDAALEREIRSDRKFSLTEAIGRMAGGGLMKGVSPVTPKRQAELQIEDYLGHHLTDTGGVLRGILLRRVGESDLLLGHYNRPLAVLADYARQVLASDFLLRDLVREADTEWGRVFGERPHFDKPGVPPDPGDPYTIDSVRTALTQLVQQIAAEQ